MNGQHVLPWHLKKVYFLHLFLSVVITKHIVCIVTSVTICVIMNIYMYKNDCIYTVYETTNMHNYIYTHACIYIYYMLLIHTHTYAYIYAYIHIHTHIYTHIHTHTCIYMCSIPLGEGVWGQHLFCTGEKLFVTSQHCLPHKLNYPCCNLPSANYCNLYVYVKA